MDRIFHRSNALPDCQTKHRKLNLIDSTQESIIGLPVVLDYLVKLLAVTPDRCASDELDDGSKYLAAFIISMILQGFGAVPLYVLGVTYLDDASPHGTASVHIGKYRYIIYSDGQTYFKQKSKSVATQFTS